MILTAAENDAGRRLDRVLRKALPGTPLSRIFALFRLKKVLVNGSPAPADYRLREGDRISLPGLPQEGAEPVRQAVKPRPAAQPPSLDILYEGAGILAVNKPAGVPTHGEASMESLARAYLADKIPPSLSFKSGPLHRLDQGTSGVLVFSTSLEGARAFSELLRSRKVKKTYLAVAEGRLEGEGVWENLIERDRGAKISRIIPPQNGDSLKRTGEDAAKHAATFYRSLALRGNHTLLELLISGGRTHQIRVQAAAAGHPLAGDAKYGGRPLPAFKGFLLHAFRLETDSPLFPPKIEAPVPASFTSFL